MMSSPLKENLQGNNEQKIEYQVDLFIFPGEVPPPHPCALALKYCSQGRAHMAYFSWGFWASTK